MTYDSLLVHGIYKKTSASSSNDLGEWTYIYTVGTSVTKCRINPISAKERIDPTGRFDDVRYICYMLSSSTIDRGDRVTYDSEDYRMKEVVLDSSAHNKKGYMVLLT